MTDKQEIDRAVERIMQAADEYAGATATADLSEGSCDFQDIVDQWKQAVPIARDALVALIRAELEARVPQGWQVVPDTATHGMIEAARAHRKRGPSTSASIYAAMLAAAPTPQQEQR